MDSAKLNLAIVCNSIPPYRVQVHQRIAREMPEVQIWTVRTHEEEARWPTPPPAELNVVDFGEGIPCSEHGLPRHAWREWRKGGRIIRWMLKQRIGAVVLLGYNDPARIRILRWCRRRGIPCFIWGDSNIRDEEAKRVRGVKAVVKTMVVGSILRWCSGALACGSRGKAFFSKYGVGSERIFLFPNEPDYAAIENLGSEDLEAARQRFSLQVGRRRMIYSGRLSSEKRVDLLIDAFVRIAVERPQWDLVIVGDGGLRPELAARVPTELASRIRWVGHQSETAAVAAIYRICDALALTSDRDAWALVINEAVAAGLAVISSDVPGAAVELVRDGVNGRIFPAGKLDALVSAMRDVTDEERIEKMKSASPMILAEWRRQADPIDGLRSALRWAGVLPRGAKLS